MKPFNRYSHLLATWPPDFANMVKRLLRKLVLDICDLNYPDNFPAFMPTGFPTRKMTYFRRLLSPLKFNQRSTAPGMTREINSNPSKKLLARTAAILECWIYTLTNTADFSAPNTQSKITKLHILSPFLRRKSELFWNVRNAFQRRYKPNMSDDVRLHQQRGEALRVRELRHGEI